MKNPETVLEKKRPAEKAVIKKSTVQADPETKKPKKSPNKPKITPEVRYQMIADAAYFRAEKFGHNGNPVDHWLMAEIEIDEMLGQKK